MPPAGRRMSFSPPLALADMRTTQYKYRSLSPLLHFTPTPNGAGSAAPTPSHGPILTACTSRGKSFVLRKCVFGLRLLTELASSFSNQARGCPRRAVRGGRSFCRHRGSRQGRLRARRPRDARCPSRADRCPDLFQEPRARGPRQTDGSKPRAPLRARAHPRLAAPPPRSRISLHLFRKPLMMFDATDLDLAVAITRRTRIR